MANTRTVKKSKGGVQDLLLGKGTQNQDRAGGTYTIDKLDIPVTADTVVEMQALDVEDFTRARVYSSVTEYIEYIYDDADLTGISSDTGNGTWHLARREVEGTEAELTVGTEVKQRWWSPRTLARWVVQLFVRNVDTIADLRNLEPLIDGQQISLLGHTNPGLGGGTFYYDASDTTSADDNGFTITSVGGKRWKRIINGPITLDMINPVEHTPGVAGTGDEIKYFFDVARDNGHEIHLTGGGNYRVTTDIRIWSEMTVTGDFSVSLYSDYVGSGGVVMRSDLAVSSYNNVHLAGFNIVRIGRNAEHGILLDAITNLTVDIRVLSDENSIGGACSIASIHPYKRKCTNCNVKVYVTHGANYGLQLGNIDGGEFRVRSFNTHRETLGLEPVAQSIISFDSSNVGVGSKFTVVGHGMDTGDAMMYLAEGNADIGSLATASYCFADVIDDDTFYISLRKSDALIGVHLTDISGTVTGTQVLLHCSTMRNVVAYADSVTESIAAKGSLTGNIVIVAASGGYFENVTLESPNVADTNATSGTHGIGVYGASGVTINNPQVSAAPLDAIILTRGFINDIPYTNEQGGTSYFNPVVATPFYPSCIVNGGEVKDFRRYGVHSDFGSSIVRDTKAQSEVTSDAGFIITADARLAKSTIYGARANVPNGVGFDALSRLVGCTDEVTQEFYDQATDKVYRGSSVKPILGDGAVYDLGTLVSASSGTTTYTGKILINARNSTAENANVAHYELSLCKASSGGTPIINTVTAIGLVNGAGASFPSFTWSVVAGNLIATPIASTAVDATFQFYVSFDGDIKI